jgi:hypothetical protein
MKNIIKISFLLSFTFLLFFSEAYSQRSNELIIEDIEKVLASSKIDAIKQPIVNGLISELKSVYLANINATTDSTESKKLEIASVANYIASTTARITSAVTTTSATIGLPANLPNATNATQILPKSPGKATFLEVPQAGETVIKAKGEPGEEYQFSVDGNDAGKTKAIDGGLLQKTVPELVAGGRVVIRPVKSDGNGDDSKGVSEEVGLYADPTKGGLFGVLVGGAVYSQQNNNFSSTSPFFGFNAGYGTSVRNADRYIGETKDGKKVVLVMSSSADNLSDTNGKIWKRDFLVPDKLIYTNGVESVTIPNKVVDTKPIWQKDGRNGGAVKLKTSCFLCTYRWGFRVQGIFEADARSATGENGTATTSTSNDFTFLTSQQTFTASAENWLEFRPLKPFSFGPYAAIGVSSLINKDDKVGNKILDDKGTPSTITKFDNDLKSFWELGAVVNLKFPDQRFFMQSILSYGRYEAYKDLDANLENKPIFNVNDTRNRFLAKIRMFPEGLNTTFGRQITLTPMFGFDLNAGNGPDNMRFFTGFAIRLKGINR